MTTGRNIFSADDIISNELFTIDGRDGRIARCSHSSQLSVPEGYDGTGALLKGYQQNIRIAIVCGGQLLGEGGEQLATCEDLSSAPGRYEKHHFLWEKRAGAASVVVNNGTDLWVTGGFSTHYSSDGHHLDSTEVLSYLSDRHSLGVLPQQLSFHCLQSVKEGNKVILYGGAGYDGITLQHTWIMDLDESLPHWSLVGEMEQERERHACGVLKSPAHGGKEVVVAAGGRVSSSFVLRSVEFLLMDDSFGGGGIWTDGPEMPFSLFNVATAVTEDQSRLFVVGGVISFTPYLVSSNVLILACLEQQLGGCAWMKTEAELLVPRESGVAILLPPNLKLASCPGGGDRGVLPALKR